MGSSRLLNDVSNSVHLYSAAAAAAAMQLRDE